MKYSELLKKSIGKEGSFGYGDYNYFLKLNVETVNINYKIVDVGDDFIILEETREYSKRSRITIPLNLFVIYC